MSVRWLPRMVVLTLAVAALGPLVAAAQPAAAPSRAPQQLEAQQAAPALPEDETVRSPDVPPPPPPQMFPRLREEVSKLPPFFRDTDLNVRLRTFYFNRQNDNDTASEAWAAGGWVQYASGWLLDTFAIGSTYYTSQPLYTPDDRPGTLLLTPGQDFVRFRGLRLSNPLQA